MPFKPYREGSRENWGINTEGSLAIEQINSGALLRIADASEKMAENYDALLRDRDFWKGRTEAHEREAIWLHRRIAGLCGYIGWLKKKA